MSHLFKMAGCFALLSPAAAYAHIGHIGELAGHGHLIGLGGLVAAAALAALVAKLSADKADGEDGLDPQRRGRNAAVLQSGYASCKLLWIDR